jgi:putative FmdB family regulatory protein
VPTYDYKCSTCETSATLITGIHEKLSIPICSHCKAEMVRDYGSPSVKFTGSGFYSTDNK